MASQAHAVKSMPQLRIMVCGRIGIGKSSLINFLLGYDVCEVGDPGESDDFDLGAKTKEVEGHPVIMNGVEVIIYDSPGLQEGGVDEQKYLEMMYEKCHDVDLVFYCHDMTVARWTLTEVNAIRALTQKFKAPFWNKVIFVLTRANMVQSANPKTYEERIKHFQNWTTSLARKFRAEVDKQLEVLATDAGEKTKDSISEHAGGNSSKNAEDSDVKDCKHANDSDHSETGEDADGKHGDGEHGDGEHGDGEHANGEHANGDPADGEHGGGENFPKSTGDAVAKDRVNHAETEEPKAGDWVIRQKPV